MKGKIFPIIFTTLIATLLFFGAMYRVKNVDNEYGIKKFQECDKKYEFSYTKGSEEIKKTYNYKIQDETALIVILDDGTTNDSEELYPTVIDELPVKVERYKTFSMKQLYIESGIFGAIVLFISLLFFNICAKIGRNLERKKQERYERKLEKKQMKENSKGDLY